MTIAETLHGNELQRATGKQYWCEGVLGEHDSSRIVRAMVRSDGIAIDYEDSHAATGINQITLTRQAGQIFTGSYVAGSGDDQEVGQVECELYENGVNLLLLGKWIGASGDYLWIVRLEPESADSTV